MDRSKYLQEVFRQLNDEDEHHRFLRWLKILVDHTSASDVIDRGLHTFLLPHDPMTPMMYCLPKIHKDFYNPPGRPIVSGRNSIESLSYLFRKNTKRICD